MNDAKPSFVKITRSSDVLQKEIRQGDCILVKGSRSMKTDEIVKELLTKVKN